MSWRWVTMTVTLIRCQVSKLNVNLESDDAMNQPNGLLLAIDGVDGAGKDTQLKFFTSWLEHVYPEREIVSVQCPAKTCVGGILRRLVLGQPCVGYRTCEEPLRYQDAASMHYVLTGPFTHDEVPDPFVQRWLLFAEYLYTYRTVIDPALARGAIVVCNRAHFTSNYVYGITAGLPAQAVETVITMQGCYTNFPDRIVVLDLPVEVAKQRLEARGEAGGEINHFDTADTALFEKRRAVYRELALHRWKTSMALVDAEGTSPQVFERVLEAFATILPPVSGGTTCA